jgi:tetratricopeptide (TPR) repeat protein
MATPRRRVAVLLALIFLSGLEPACKEKTKEEAGGRPPSGALPPLEIVDGVAPSAGAPAPKVVKIDQEALDKACAAAKLPAPPDLTKLPPALAQAIHEALKPLMAKRSAAAYGRLGHLYRMAAGEAKDLLRAAECYEAAKALEPQVFEWPYHLGRIFSDRGSTERADVEFGEAEKLKPDYAMIAWWRGQIELNAKHADKARIHFERYVALKPEDPWGYDGIGTAQLRAQNFEAALAAGQKAAQLRPNDRWAHVLMSQAYARLGDTERADQERKAAEALPQESPESETLGRDPVELAVWTQWPVGIVTVRIDSLLAAGRTSEAAVLCEAVLKDHPQDESILTKLGWLYLRLGRAEEAVATAQRLLKNKAENVPAMELLAEGYAAAGRREEALGQFRRLTELEPSNSRWQVRLGEYLAAGGQGAEAMQHMLKAVQLAPDQGYPHYLLGILKDRDGDAAGAKEQYAQAIQVAPKMTETYVALSLLARREKDAAGAEHYLREGLKNAPEAALLANALAWTLATHPDAARRKGAEAVRWAEQACKATQNARAEYLDTLAAAYAEAGRFAEAVQAERAALQRATGVGGAESMLEGFQARLALYEAGKPYHEAE